MGQQRQADRQRKHYQNGRDKRVAVCLMGFSFVVQSDVDSRNGSLWHKLELIAGRHQLDVIQRQAAAIGGVDCVPGQRVFD